MLLIPTTKIDLNIHIAERLLAPSGLVIEPKVNEILKRQWFVDVLARKLENPDGIQVP
jgi:hypothetical protein